MLAYPDNHTHVTSNRKHAELVPASFLWLVSWLPSLSTHPTLPCSHQYLGTPGSFAAGVMQIFVPKDSEPSILLPFLGCCSSSLTFTTRGPGNVKEHLQRIPWVPESLRPLY